MAASKQGKRTYDIVVFGASGFTGTLVAEYLAGAESARGLRWAIAGRNRDKLTGVVDALGLSGVDVLIGDSDDEPSLRAIAAATKVVCTTVGPYAKYGSKLVAACVTEGTHYCDLTGEVPWIRDMIDAHHDAAREVGARIVHCCGFDSIPSDLGTLMMHQAMAARGLTLASVDALAHTKGTASGGTVASMLGIVDAARKDKAVRRVLGNPYGLNPRGEDSGPDGPDPTGVSYEPRLNTWTAPFVMAAINTRIVRRSNALRGYEYGRNFRYRERASVSGGPKGLAIGLGVSAGLAAFVVGTQLPGVRGWLERKLPSPGEGPDKHARDTGSFALRFIAESAESPTTRLIGTVSHDRDPGYGSTCVMLSEAALCLAKDDLSSPGGVLTPASAMGTALIERLRAAGLKLSVED